MSKNVLGPGELSAMYPVLQFLLRCGIFIFFGSSRGQRLFREEAARGAAKKLNIALLWRGSR